MKKNKVFTVISLACLLVCLFPLSVSAEDPETIETVKAENTDLWEKNEALEKEVAALKEQLEEIQDETAEETASIEDLDIDFSDTAVISMVQQALNDAGYLCGTPDGIIGQKTTAAILNFEKENHLDKNGAVTAALIKALKLEDKILQAADTSSVHFAVPSGFTNGYEYADYSIFNSYASENGLKDTKVWLSGSYESVSSMDLSGKGIAMNVYCCDFTDSQGNEWLLMLDLNYLELKTKYEARTGHPLCAVGRYQGYSALYEKPSVMLETFFDQNSGDLISSAWYGRCY